MPHWICPLCQASCHVPAAALGRTLKCPSCRESSPVSTGDLVDDPQPAIRQQSASSGSLIVTAANSRLMSASTSIGLLALLVPAMCVGSVFLLVYINWIMGAILLGSLALIVLIVSPLLDALHEVHRCRKLLEMIANQRDS